MKISKEMRYNLLTIIDEERVCFIRSQQGRLQAAIGAEYWDPAAQASGFFHKYRGDMADAEFKADPFELTLSEIVWLTGLEKKVERICTVSYFSLFPADPTDIARLRLLERLEQKLEAGAEPDEAECTELERGHAAFIKAKTNDPVLVIR